MSFQLEICCYDLPSCIVAQQGGANRIELCADPANGGTTASYGTIKTVKGKTGIDVYPIIRPRGGNFLYNDDEFAIMQKDILTCKELGCEGVVIGILQADGSIDKKRCAILVTLAYPMEVTFHRAFDRAAHPMEALEDIIDIGCSRLLTSGQHPTAMEGIQLIGDLVKQADERIIIMPGSGVRSSNIAEIAAKTGAIAFHSSASTPAANGMNFSNETMRETLQYITADKNQVEQMIQVLTAYYKSIAIPSK